MTSQPFHRWREEHRLIRHVLIISRVDEVVPSGCGKQAQTLSTVIPFLHDRFLHVLSSNVYSIPLKIPNITKAVSEYFCRYKQDFSLVNRISFHRKRK